MHRNHLSLGKRGEELAAAFLEKKGYKIIKRNYKTRLGEIDIIARDKDTLCFVEVKARHSDKYGLPQEAISRFKQRQISKAALIYLKANNLLDKKARFDVVAVISAGDRPDVHLIQDAFSLEDNFTY